MNIYQDLLLPLSEFLGGLWNLIHDILYYPIIDTPNTYVDVLHILPWLGVSGIVLILIISIIKSVI